MEQRLVQLRQQYLQMLPVCKQVVIELALLERNDPQNPRITALEYLLKDFQDKFARYREVKEGVLIAQQMRNPEDVEA